MGYIQSKTEHENIRRKLWIDMCIAVSHSDTCISKTSPTTFADSVLKAFDERFSNTYTYDFKSKTRIDL